jgi:hypothetical protein
MRGEDPYSLIGPGELHYWNFPLLYPLPAVIIAIPFVAIPLIVARAVFVALTSGALAYVVTRRDWWPLLVFASAPWMDAVALAQWSPAVLLAWYLPALGFLLAAKPNVGIAVLAGSRDRRSLATLLVAMAAITAVAFVAMPSWFQSWLHAVSGQPHIRSLAFSLLGAPLLLAALRWRRPEARLLLMLALVPQNPAIYEGVILFAVALRAREALVLATLSWMAEPLANALGPAATFADGAKHNAVAMLVCMYLPALVMVLVRRNESPQQAASITPRRSEDTVRQSAADEGTTPVGAAIATTSEKRSSSADEKP